MNDIKEARELLRKNGYFVQNLWCDDDIIGKAKEQGIELTPEQAIEVMEQMGRNFDAELGVNWDTIEEAIRIYNK